MMSYLVLGIVAAVLGSLSVLMSIFGYDESLTDLDKLEQTLWFVKGQGWLTLSIVILVLYRVDK